MAIDFWSFEKLAIQHMVRYRFNLWLNFFTVYLRQKSVQNSLKSQMHSEKTILEGSLLTDDFWLI